MDKNLKPFAIKADIDGITYNFHGFNHRGCPSFMVGYACLDTNFYWRTYKHSSRALIEAKKCLHHYRRYRKGVVVRVVDMINDKDVYVLA